MTQPIDLPGPHRPVPVQPVPASIGVQPVDGAGPDGPLRLVQVSIITAAGSAFAFFAPEQVEKVFADGVRICQGQKAGLIVPINGIIRPNGAG